jgi:D-glycero-alpha-D-manno-heptose-7-phosphate kinase
VGNLKQNAASMHEMRQMVDRAIQILTSPAEDLVEFGKLLKEAWTLKRSLSDRVSNATVDSLMETAIRAGALGGKLLGAGGGGFALLFVRPEERAQVQKSLRHLITVPFKFEMSGSRIVLYQPDGL